MNKKIPDPLIEETYEVDGKTMTKAEFDAHVAKLKAGGAKQIQPPSEPPK